MAKVALTGIRVLDLGMITAGASSSALLADLGADVIKVEAGSYLDIFREFNGRVPGTEWWNCSGFFNFTNRNKIGLGLELKEARGREIFLQLVARSDVVLENFRRGVLERLRLTYDDLRAVNPSIILCSVTSQGERGPERAAASYGSTLEATSGLAAMTGYPGGPPVISGVALNYPDQIIAMFAAGMVVTAIMERRRTGQGAHLDISQRELASFLLGEHVVAGKDQPRRGNADPTAALQACVQANDGAWLALRVAPQQAIHLDTLLGLAAPGVALRDATLRAWAAIRNADAVFEELDRAGLTPTHVNDADQLAIMATEGSLHHAYQKDPSGGWAKGFPFQFRATPMRVHRPAPKLGEHTDEILRDLLGLDDAARAALAADGITATRPKG